MTAFQSQRAPTPTRRGSALAFGAAAGTVVDMLI